MKLNYFDNDIAVCIKPVGLDSEKQVPYLLKQELSGDFFPVHRLDLNVSGVMVYARNKSAAAALSKAIQENTMIKEYVAMVHGTPAESGVLEDLLFKDSRKNKVFVVQRIRHGVKKAKLEFTRLTKGEASLVHIRLHTGRSHQIRVQFSSRGYPLVGDHKYGSKSEVKEPMLYSYRITFPYKGKMYSFKSLPEWVPDHLIEKNNECISQ